MEPSLILENWYPTGWEPHHPKFIWHISSVTIQTRKTTISTNQERKKGNNLPLIFCVKYALLFFTLFFILYGQQHFGMGKAEEIRIQKKKNSVYLYLAITELIEMRVKYWISLLLSPCMSFKYKKTQNNPFIPLLSSYLSFRFPCIHTLTESFSGKWQ